ncbi:hypothetical protein [Curvibacter lanceolatus]|uniref:hypothetical protein n=1 Tax=Curvibacter lanceolatus TaxID=86182 RepID=UPI0004CF60F6|nr:hypothetical protein [Curvibacter lanceolatus]
MKQAIRSMIFVVASLVVAGPVPVFAQTTKPSPVQPSIPNVQEFDKQLSQAQENMKLMQEQMEKIRQTQDSQARQKLLQDHWATMQSNMQLMHGMWGASGGAGCCMRGSAMGPGMMMDGPMMGWGHMGGYYSKLTPEQQKQRQYMTDQYMPMQQFMMDHMMQHNQWMWQSR